MPRSTSRRLLTKYDDQRPEPQIDIRVTRFASARLAITPSNASLTPREYEVHYLQLPDGTERTYAKPVPAVIVNPFVDGGANVGNKTEGDDA